MFGRIFIGLIGMVVGVVVTIKANWIVERIGRLESIEKYLGSFGGTRMFLLILGVLITLGSVLYMTGVLQSGLQGIADSLFGR